MRLSKPLIILTIISFGLCVATSLYIKNIPVQTQFIFHPTIIPTPTFFLYPTNIPTPSSTQTKISIFCGGIAGKTCPAGYECIIDESYPDAGGTCRKEETENEDFTCPENGYLDCMPGPDQKKTGCNQKYIEWAKEHCPGFTIAY